MGILDRARSLFLTPADRRLRAAAAEAFSSAPTPSTALAVHASPFGGGISPPGNPPPIQWWNDQVPPSPTAFTFRGGYSDHTYQSFAAPYGFEHFDLDRIRGAVALHRRGLFLESSTLMVALMSFAPVLAALQQAIAPILALPRHIHGGDRGLAKVLAADVEEMLVPRSGLLPSPYLPPETWGTMAIYLRMLGFCVLQHVDGDADPVTGVRSRYTRVWEPWAVNKYRSPRKWIALTTEGPIEIKNDGKFTLVIDENEGDLTGAIVALGEEVLGGKLTWEAWLSYLDFFGKPKLYATLPEKVPTTGDAGDAFQASVETIYGPDGRGVLPYGATLEAVGLKGTGGESFLPAIANAVVHIAMILLGTDGTIKSGGMDGTGAYRPAAGGPWNVRHDLIARPTMCIVRALNGGHIAPWLDENHGDEIAAAKRAGTWKDPILTIPLPAPDRDERIASEIARQKALSDQVLADREAGADVDQDRVERLAQKFEAIPFTLAARKEPPISITDTDRAKVYRVREVRAGDGYAPLGDERDDLTLAELEAIAKQKAGANQQAAEGGEQASSPDQESPKGDKKNEDAGARTTALLSALDIALGGP